MEIESESVHFIYHGKDQDKGAGIRSEIEQVAGDIVVIQDADLEDDLEEFTILLKTLKARRMPHTAPGLGIRDRIECFFLAYCLELTAHVPVQHVHEPDLTDIETCYKMIRTDTSKQTNIKQNRFGFGPKITAKLALIKNTRFYEFIISYRVSFGLY